VYRWTAAEPNLRWIHMNSHGLQVTVEDISDRLGALALQGPTSRAILEKCVEGADVTNLKYFRVIPGRLRGIPVEISRTGLHGDLGYEIWVPWDKGEAVWDALMEAGRPYDITPTGMLALDVARIEAGLILLDVDYVSSRKALIPSQQYSPYEIGLGRLVNLEKSPYIGQQSLRAEAKKGPARQLVGLEVDWDDLDRCTTRSACRRSFRSRRHAWPCPSIAGASRWGRRRAAPGRRPEEDDRAGHAVVRSGRAGHEAGDGVHRQPRAQAGGRRGEGAAVLRPAPQAGLSFSPAERPAVTPNRDAHAATTKNTVMSHGLMNRFAIALIHRGPWDSFESSSLCRSKALSSRQERRGGAMHSTHLRVAAPTRESERTGGALGKNFVKSWFKRGTGGALGKYSVKSWFNTGKASAWVSHEVLRQRQSLEVVTGHLALGIDAAVGVKTSRHRNDLRVRPQSRRVPDS
jgi:hypothetical protein